ncbi:MAG TPA: hypothetical protein VFV41_23355 [Streptosporangiaceae bacterium]|nr:hypothetical protein [Streptosporangiaceae bacterium]
MDVVGGGYAGRRVGRLGSRAGGPVRALSLAVVLAGLGDGLTGAVRRLAEVLGHMDQVSRRVAGPALLLWPGHPARALRGGTARATAGRAVAPRTACVTAPVIPVGSVASAMRTAPAACAALPPRAACTPSGTTSRAAGHASRSGVTGFSGTGSAGEMAGLALFVPRRGVAWPGLPDGVRGLPRVHVPRPRVRVPRPGLPLPRLRRPRPRGVRPASLAAGVAWLVVAAALFTVYLAASRTAPVNSDGASNALQAWAMLHGNPLLRGWQLSDVSFYTTELPQYALVELVRGLGPDVVHVAGAMTYTVVVVLAGLLARGRATGRAGVLRAGLAMGIMAAPQQAGGVYVLMLSPDHFGSAVPVLATWILLDRAPRRWWVPPAAAVLLAWGLIADPIVAISGVAPLAAIGAARGYRVVVQQRQRLRSAWFEAGLVLAAAAAAEGARLILQLISASGGFHVWPAGNQLADFAQLGKNLVLTLQGILLLFGADFFGRNLGYAAVLAMLHLAGIGLAAWAVGAALRRLGRADLAVQLTVTALLVSLAAYLLGRNALDLHSTREFTAVLPLGAALAGRLLAGRLAAARLIPAAAIVLTAYLLSLGQVAAVPAAPAQASQLAAWLSREHLYYGLGGYWQSNVVTLDTGGKVRVRAVLQAGPVVIRDNWETRPDWYDPALHQANFIVLSPGKPGAPPFPSVTNVQATFGQPARICTVGPYTVLIYGKNLLAELPAT